MVSEKRDRVSEVTMYMVVFEILCLTLCVCVQKLGTVAQDDRHYVFTGRNVLNFLFF